ncbi:uncharacterized protein LOC116853717 [Odontomachus brunneus]|uniref:uncharacterized protein LOC116853717 n=1 Tax=Odontomachus brunneus TaxID=486640 RepID=UPI0013F243CE|nr:uncharacterized protein LOC116853717 [Odontomachus brunneus]
MMASTIRNMESEKLTLIDAESNVEYSIIVSLEVAEKVRNDHKFAYALLEEAKRKKQKENPMEVNRKKRVISKSENTDMDVIANINDPSCSENKSTFELKDQHIWTRSETMLLINTYKEHGKLH